MPVAEGAAPIQPCPQHLLRGDLPASGNSPPRDVRPREGSGFLHRYNRILRLLGKNLPPPTPPTSAKKITKSVLWIRIRPEPEKFASQDHN
jgi:hypothetical protein